MKGINKIYRKKGWRNRGCLKMSFLPTFWDPYKIVHKGNPKRIFGKYLGAKK